MDKLRKSAKLTSMNLKELKKTWRRLTQLVGIDHPRHFLYQGVLEAAKTAEMISKQYPNYYAPGLGERVEKDHGFRKKLHMWALDKFNHSNYGGEMALLLNLASNYKAARDEGQRLKARTEAWLTGGTIDQTIYVESGLLNLVLLL